MVPGRVVRGVPGSALATAAQAEPVAIKAEGAEEGVRVDQTEEMVVMGATVDSMATEVMGAREVGEREMVETEETRVGAMGTAVTAEAADLQVHLRRVVQVDLVDRARGLGTEETAAMAVPVAAAVAAVAVVPAVQAA